MQCGYSEPMRVKLLSFGVLKDVLGVATEDIEIPNGSTVGELLEILERRTSNLTMNDKVWQSLAVAVNREYSSTAAALRDGDEVALLPPVSGGSSADGESCAWSNLLGGRVAAGQVSGGCHAD